MSGVSLFGSVDQAVFLAANQLVGRSWLVDSLLSLSLDNPVVKAGPIAACFLFAWNRTGGTRLLEVRRRVLLVTLVSLFLVAPAVKLLSEGRLAPRPFVLALPGYGLSDGQLARSAPLDVRVPQTGEMAARAEALRQGTVASNDFDAFPSDHAAFYFAMALGIFLACRSAGLVALLWAAMIVFGVRIAVGMHWLSDIVVGAAIGGLVLGVLQLAAVRFRQRFDPWLLRLTERYKGLTAAVLFLLLIETTGPLKTVERLRDLAGSIVGHET